ncbi:MAG: type IV toxin-antitoxin system AbiEi family antitoxin domain-containing protein [bacterium]
MKQPLNQNFSDWLDSLKAQGRSSFTKAEAQKAYGARLSGLPMVLHRLLKARQLAKPKTGFYLILDPPYRAAGSQPPEWFIDPLMKHLGLPYYVGGLSAAAHYGATHQALQELQVVVPGDRKGLRPIQCGRARIRFLLKSSFDKAATQQGKSQAGYYKVASPETAAWDMVYFHYTLGGLNQAALAIVAMAPAMDPKRLKSVAKSHDDSGTARRLGWVLEKCGLAKLAAVLRPRDIEHEPWRMVEQGSEGPMTARRSRTWHLIENLSLDLEA